MTASAPTITRSNATPAGLAVAAAVAALLAIAGAYWPAQPWLHWLFKPLTTLLIAWTVWRLPSALPRYRAWLLAGLLLSTLGDVFLMLPVDAFVPGLASFLLAHLAYLLALRQRGRWFSPVWTLLAYAVVALAVLSQLWPGLPAALRVPVVIYVAVLAAMAAQALAVWWRLRDGPSRFGAWGGACFVLSDALLAWDRFVAPFAAASLAVLASYWLAQWGLARSAPPAGRD